MTTDDPKSPALDHDTEGSVTEPQRPTAPLRRFDPLAVVERLRALPPPDPAEVQRAEARRQRERVRAERERADALGIPGNAELRAVVFAERPRMTAALSAVEEALVWRARRRVGQVLVLGGPPGTGKSTAVARALYQRGRGVWVAATDLAARPRNAFSENERAWELWLGAVTLVVDDLGLEPGDPNAVAGLLSRRFDAGLLTLCTTNMTQETFAHRYLGGALGDRLADRLLGQKDRGCNTYRETGSKSLRRIL